MSSEKELKHPFNLMLDMDVNKILTDEKKKTGRSLSSLINQAVRLSYQTIE
jgi:hypothetical protein